MIFENRSVHAYACMGACMCVAVWGNIQHLISSKSTEIEIPNFIYSNVDNILRFWRKSKNWKWDRVNWT